MWFNKEELFQEVIEQNKTFADRHGKQLVVVESNIREWTYANNISWADRFVGGGLASITHVLAVSIMYNAASQSYSFYYTDGSHPTTDPLWSTETCTIYYDGAVLRTEKLKSLSKDPEIINTLRVCWQNNVYNCGRCEKCLRTMMGLHLLDLTSESFPAMNKESFSQFKKIRIHDVSDQEFMEDLYQLAKEKGDRSVIRGLQWKFFRERIIKSLVKMDQLFFRGFFQEDTKPCV